MARLVPTGLIVALSALSGTALAADPANSPWSSGEKPVHVRNFSIVDDRPVRPNRDLGARIIAGTDVMPNGRIGIGFFGQKAASSPLDPVTTRLPGKRKPAVGFSLRF